jgi:hypothetical protein
VIACSHFARNEQKLEFAKILWFRLGGGQITKGIRLNPHVILNSHLYSELSQKFHLYLGSKITQFAILSVA